MPMVYKHQHVMKNSIGHLIKIYFKYQIKSKSMFKYINHKQTTSKALEQENQSINGKDRTINMRENIKMEKKKPNVMNESPNLLFNLPLLLLQFAHLLQSIFFPKDNHVLGCFHPRKPKKIVLLVSLGFKALKPSIMGSKWAENPPKTCDAPTGGPLTTHQPAEYKWMSGYPTLLQKIGQSLLCTGSSTQVQHLYEPVPNSQI